MGLYGCPLGSYFTCLSVSTSPWTILASTGHAPRRGISPLWFYPSLGVTPRVPPEAVPWGVCEVSPLSGAGLLPIQLLSLLCLIVLPFFIYIWLPMLTVSFLVDFPESRRKYYQWCFLWSIPHPLLSWKKSTVVTIIQDSSHNSLRPVCVSLRGYWVPSENPNRLSLLSGSKR